MNPLLKKVKPLLGRVVVQKYVAPKKTTSGILLPDSKVANNVAKVIEVGPGRLSDNGTLIPPTLKAGEYVLLPEYGGIKLPKTEGYEELYIYQHEDIVAVVEGEFNNKI
jgi:chaperonin GroES